MHHPLRLERADGAFSHGSSSQAAPEARRRLPKWQVVLFAITFTAALLDGVLLIFAPLFVTPHAEMALIGVFCAAMVVLTIIIGRAAALREQSKPD